ncbi:MAG: hypothetical protein LBB91_08870 [Clostridiales bacterium]|jgi:hypothetical protein|nr:hypothetical protein [Clostridiales bacterium]
MSSNDFTMLSRKALFEHFEQERKEWLNLGMSEADISLIHFGENGKGGDFGTWLAERRQKRADHKYCPGSPLSIEVVDSNGIWIYDPRDEIGDVEMRIDMERIFNMLTALQRFCFKEVCLIGRTFSDVAREREKHQSTIQESVRAAKEKIKQNIFCSYPEIRDLPRL